MSETKVLAGPHSLQRLKGRMLPCLFLVSGGCQQSLVFLGLKVHRSNCCLYCHMTFSPCLVFSQGVLFLCVSSHTDTSHIRLELTLMTSSYFIFIACYFQVRYEGLGLQSMNLWRGTIQPITVPHRGAWLAGACFPITPISIPFSSGSLFLAPLHLIFLSFPPKWSRWSLGSSGVQT